jgi:NTE family protein
MDAMLRGVPGFFSPRPFNLFAAGVPVMPDNASFYDTSPLEATLNELVDFDYLNAPGGMRLTVNALKVTCGDLASFDNTKQKLEAAHVMASGALPPGFPPVRIDGELYWDGGLYSNTPLESVLAESPSRGALCFMVDLWNAHGQEPRTFDEVQTRQKDVTFASRSMRHIRAYMETHRLQSALRQLYNRLPAKQRTAADRQMLAELGCDTTLHIIRIPYPGQDWHMPSKDINFAKGSVEWRWDQGYHDASRAIQQAGWLQAVPEDTAIVLHEITPAPPHCS